MKLQNLHTHTSFCDGKNSIAQIVQSAIDLGMSSIGLSGHAALPFPCSWAMKAEDVPLYYTEARRQQALFAGKIPVYVGIEQDYYSPTPAYPYEYIIGGVHYVKKNDRNYSMDHSAQALMGAAKESYGGDLYGLAEDYYATVAKVADKTGCQIVAHFDLICKHNQDDCLFDTNHPRYRTAALDALDALCGKDLIFEINTGAMSRGVRTTPYPDKKLLLAMRQRNLPICICADSHSANTLLYAFREAAELARSCGYKECMYWDGKHFYPDQLPF